jgi:hypothetical protein
MAQSGEALEPGGARRRSEVHPWTSGGNMTAFCITGWADSPTRLTRWSKTAT